MSFLERNRKKLGQWKHLPVTLIVVVSLVLYIFTCLHSVTFTKTSDNLSALLLFIPIIFSILAVVFEHDHKIKINYSIASSVASLIYLFFWFCWGKYPTNESLGKLATLMVFLIFAYSIYLLIFLYRNGGPNSRPPIIRRLGAVFHFFALFACITYLLSFALAYHDQHVRAEAKEYKENRGYTAKILRYAIYKQNFPGLNKYVRPNPDPPCSHEHSSYSATWLLLFEETSGLLITNQNEKPPESTPNERKARIADYNSAVIDSVASEISQYAHSDRIAIVVSGHATTPDIDTQGYASNYELSQARSRNVYYNLVKRFRCIENDMETIYPQIEWFMVPSSNEPFRISPERDYMLPFPSDLHENLEEIPTVEISILELPNDPTYQFAVAAHQEDNERCGEPDLLEYIYFMIYTITTTGYGDIVPVSDQAKFLGSVANFIEVFYMVIFFAAVMQAFAPVSSCPYRGDRRDGDDSKQL